MKESEFQAKLIRKLKDRFPNCIVVKNDPTYIQGIPDLIVLNGDRWAALECKRYSNASHRPNQDYYIDKMDRMSFASFVYPENMEDILDEVQQAFES